MDDIKSYWINSGPSSGRTLQIEIVTDDDERWGQQIQIRDRDSKALLELLTLLIQPTYLMQFPSGRLRGDMIALMVDTLKELGYTVFYVKKGTKDE